MKNKKYILALVFMMVFPIFVTDVFAVTNTNSLDTSLNTIATDTGLSRGTGNSPIATTIGKAVALVLSFVGGLSVLFIIVGGIMYVISSGDDKKTETAKKLILYSIVGLVISLLAWVIIKTIIGAL